MKILDKVNNNLFGASYESQKNIISTLVNSLKEGKGNKVSKELESLFEGYFESVDELIEFKNLYQTFNSNQRRVSRRLTLKELMEAAENHHIDNSDSRIAQHFVYSSEEFTEYAKKQEYMSFFKPQNLSDEEVQEFLTTYEILDEERKMDFVDDMTIYYDRLKYFSFIHNLRVPVGDSILEQYRKIIEDLIGQDMMQYYDSLYPQEQLSLIECIAGMCRSLTDEEYLARRKEEMQDDPKYIRRLKKEVKDTCRITFRKFDKNE